MATKTAPAKTNRTFKAGLCHHRNEQGAPDCTKPVVRASANMCDRHQKMWSDAAKARAAARKPATPAKVVPLRERKPAPAPERVAHPRTPKGIAAMVAVEPTAD